MWAVADGGGANVSTDEVCRNKNVIAVGASAQGDNVKGISAAGPALVAPGVQVITTTPDDADWCGSAGVGASFAAPIVAGVAALMLTCNGNLTATQVRQQLALACDKVPNGRPYDHVTGLSKVCGAGRINAYTAVTNATTA